MLLPENVHKFPPPQPRENRDEDRSWILRSFLMAVASGFILGVVATCLLILLAL